MSDEPFAALARELAERDRELPRRLADAARHAERLRAHADACVAKFCAAASVGGARHLTSVRVGPVEPDEKHVDCWQFRVERGRWVAVCVVKARGVATLVGPFQRGKNERPCRDVAFDAPDAFEALETLLLGLLREASER
jgi:hypothetical protein